MITRLTARNRSNVRNPYGPPRTGFPSVRSNMLKDEDVRGDAFMDTSKFNYSNFAESKNTKLDAKG